MSETIYPVSRVCGGKYEVCEWKTYEKGSVLEGQSQECVLDIFNSLEDAKNAYPNAEVSDSGRCKEYRPSVSPSPPSGFDYYDAGEHWHEDDY